MSKRETDRKLRELYDGILAEGEERKKNEPEKSAEETLAEIEKFKEYFVPDIPEKLRDDREFMLRAVKINGEALHDASERLKRDKELILLAAKDCEWFMFDIPEEHLKDRKFVLALLSENGMFLWTVKSKQKGPLDGELIKTAVRQNFEAARFVKPLYFDEKNPMCDKKFVLELVKISGRTLQYAYEPFRDDEEVVLEAVTSYRAFEFASNRLKHNEDFLVRVLDKNPSCLAYAPARYREDKTLVAALMKKHPYVYRYAKEDIRLDFALAVEALSGDVRIYSYVPKKLRESKRFLDEIERLIEEGVFSDEDAKYLRDCVEIANLRPEDVFKNVVTIVDKRDKK